MRREYRRAMRQAALEWRKCVKDAQRAFYWLGLAVRYRNLANAEVRDNLARIYAACRYAGVSAADSDELAREHCHR